MIRLAADQPDFQEPSGPIGITVHIDPLPECVTACAPVLPATGYDQPLGLWVMTALALLVAGVLLARHAQRLGGALQIGHIPVVRYIGNATIRVRRERSICRKR